MNSCGHINETNPNGIGAGSDIILPDRVSRVKVLFMPYTEPEELVFYAAKYEASRGKHTDYFVARM